MACDFSFLLSFNQPLTLFFAKISSHPHIIIFVKIWHKLKLFDGGFQCKLIRTFLSTLKKETNDKDFENAKNFYILHLVIFRWHFNSRVGQNAWSLQIFACSPGILKDIYVKWSQFEFQTIFSKFHYSPRRLKFLCTNIAGL